MYSLLFFVIIIGSVFILIQPISGEFTDKMILILTIVLIAFIYIRDELKFKMIEGWYSTHLLIHPYLLLSIFGFSIFLINYSSYWVDWFYLLVPLCWFIVYLVTFYYYNILLKYIFNYFKTLKTKNIEKHMSLTYEALEESFENVLFKNKDNLMGKSDNKVIEIPDKSVIIHMSGNKIIVSGKEETNIKKVISLINNNVV